MSEKWSWEELEFLEEGYDEQETYQHIADKLNGIFHEGRPVRTVNSISYGLTIVFGDDRERRMDDTQ